MNEQANEAALAEWREDVGVRIMHAMRCTHDGDDFGPGAVCVTCFENTQRIGVVLVEAVRVAARERLAREEAGTRFRIETACDGYANLTIDDIPGDVFTEDDYMAGAADAANAIRAALAASSPEVAS